MDTVYIPMMDHHGPLSKKRMHLRPMLPIPVNYETAAIPTFAPFGTEYTPDHSIKIIGGRRISIPHSLASIPRAAIPSSTNNLDPDFVPNKALQHVHAVDNAQWQQPTRPRFDTTYRTEYINRIRHPEYIPWYQQPHLNAKIQAQAQAEAQRKTNSSLNQYNILPPIHSNATSTMSKFRSVGSARSRATDVSQSSVNHNGPNREIKPNDVPPLNLGNGNQNFQGPPQPPPPPQQFDQPMMNNVDTYLPEEPVLLTNYEEDRLAEQIRVQLGRLTTVEKLKLFYQELSSYDSNVTGHVHYSQIQLVASQLGLNLQEDTLRFAMCKFVAPDRGRGFVNYEDMIRYLGKCLASISPNQYDLSRPSHSWNYHHQNFHGHPQATCRCGQGHRAHLHPPCPIHHPHP